MRVGLLVDVVNLYYCLKDQKLDYEKLYNYASSLGTIQKAVVYGSQLNGEADGFIYNLKKLGYEVNYTCPKIYRGVAIKSNRDIDICLDAVTMCDHFDTLILCTGDNDFSSVVKYVKSKGVHTIIVGASVGKKLYRCADQVIELKDNEEFLK